MFDLMGILLSSIALLMLTVFLTWYINRAAVMNQVRRPLIINTPSKMLIFTVVRLLTTGLAVLGIYYVYGLVAAVSTYLIRFVCKRMIYRHCFKRAVAEQTALLLKWQKEDADNSGAEFDLGEMYPICFNAAVEAVNANIRGEV